MADNKNSANTLVCESQEALYARAVKKMRADRLIIQHAFKIENYLTAAAMFDEVGAYLDSEELAAKCRKLAEETRAEQKKSQYQKALDVKEKAEKDSDYDKAITLFQELGTYENAQQELAECEKLKAAYEKSFKKKEVTLVVALVLCVGLVAGGFYTGFFRYMMAVCYDSMGYYEKAEDIFLDLDILNSQEKALACHDKLLREQEAEAMNELKNAKVGDSVIFGSNQWKVLDRQQDQILLVLKEVDKKSPFYQVSYSEVQDAAAWETCTLKNWLNGEVLETIFDEEEMSAMVSMDGEMVTILSVEQAEAYKEELISLTGRDYWLKDQGAEENMSAFVSAAGEIMMYGYLSDALMSVRPVITVDCTKLIEEEEA